MFLQISVWITGFIYEILNGSDKDPDFLTWLHLTR
jgi:hypothetical protein